MTEHGPTQSPADALRFDRSQEDYLDWLENHQRLSRKGDRMTGALIGIAFALTAATVAAMAFVGF